MNIATAIEKSGTAIEWAADNMAMAKQTCKGFVRYIFKDDSMICVDDEGEAKAYESSKTCGGKWVFHFYDGGYCEFCGIHEDEA